MIADSPAALDSKESPRLCIHCGWPNPQTASACSQCHAPFVSDEEKARAGDELLLTRDSPDISALAFNFSAQHGFSHPDWNGIAKQVGEHFREEDWWAAYHEISKQWLLQLKEELGGAYHRYESGNFLLLCAEGAAAARSILQSAEHFLAILEKNCGPLLNRKTYGKRVIIAFSEEDDYYAYVSNFVEEGDHARSSGVMIHRGWPHIAVILNRVLRVREVIAHELAHNCVAHLVLPTWLNEGFAQRLQHLLANSRLSLDYELADEHRAFWNEENIQRFWSGTSFYGPDEGNKLSYSLADILVALLSENWNVFLEFVLRADYRDAGQDAALQILDKNLGELLSGLLGPGDWRPQRKIIAEHLNKRAKPRPDK